MPRRWLRWVMARATPRELRDDLLINLDAGWRRRSAEDGEPAARRWYARQVRASLGPMLSRRLALLAHVLRYVALGQEMRYAACALFRAPGTTIMSVLALALGIGVTATTFSVVNGVLLRPLPYADPGGLVVVLEGRSGPVSATNLFDWRGQAGVFSEMAAAEYWTPTIGGTDPEKVYALHVTPNLLPMIGATPAIGAGIVRGPARERDVVIADSLWHRRFHGDPAALGRVLILDGEAFTVVGIMPPGFRFAPFWATKAELWAPMALESRGKARDDSSLRVFARLQPGVSVDWARTEMAAVTASLEHQKPGTNRDITVTPLMDMVVGDVRLPIMLLTAGVGCVLLIACANVAHVLLARAVSRQKEIAIRLALGAGRGRIAWRYLLEGLMLAAAGACGGLVLARYGVHAVARLAGSTIPRVDAVHLDGGVFIFTAGVAVVCAMVFGWLPSRVGSTKSLAPTLHEGERGSTGHRGHRLRSALVASEMALSLLLLVGAGLMIRSFVALRAIDPGFDPDGVVSMIVAVNGSAEAPAGRRREFYEAMLASAAATPGVESASAINHIPLAGDIWGMSFGIEGEAVPAGARPSSATYRATMPGYFRTMRLPLVAGRDFTDRDTLGSPGVIIINDYFARQHWPVGDAVGRRVRVEGELRTIVGVCKNAVRGEWTGPAGRELYVPMLQSHRYLEDPGAHAAYITLVARTAGDPRATASALRSQVRALAPDVAISEVNSLTDIVDQATGGARFILVLLGALGIVALALSALGIYGVMTLIVSSRRHEIGIRMALGATPRTVRAAVVRDGLALAVTGTAIGAVAAAVLSRLLTRIVFGVSATDVTTFACAAVTLVTVAGIACYIPARRASRVDPLAELR